jgi:hypothetical protein
MLTAKGLIRKVRKNQGMRINILGIGWCTLKGLSFQAGPVKVYIDELIKSCYQAKDGGYYYYEPSSMKIEVVEVVNLKPKTIASRLGLSEDLVLQIVQSEDFQELYWENEDKKAEEYNK